jgi:hypothetical protein
VWHHFGGSGWCARSAETAMARRGEEEDRVELCCAIDARSCDMELCERRE